MERFKIIAKIGEGAYSTVYTVRRIEDNELYALKKVKLKGLSEREKQNALNEVRILASVKSPYVISYKESFIDEIDSTLCIVMEYADEGDLFQKITLYKKIKTNFDEADIWRIFIQITKGLHDLHSYKILHRDMKSANVFLFRDGSAKLGDLNVSKISSRGLGCTQTGTPYYASPEVWKDNPYDLKSDIWSLGCVTYEMCMLRTPFRAETMEGLFNKILNGKYQRINIKYSDDLNNIIGRLLMVKPSNRPTTEEILNMDEVLLKIEEYDIFKKMKYNDRINSGIKSKRFTAMIAATVESNIDNSLIRSNDNNNPYYNLENLYEEDSKIVLDTIRMPKKLKLLNKRLPKSNYESEKIFEMKKKINNMSFPNKIFPILKCRYNDENNKKEIPKLLKGKDSLKHKNYKSIEIEKINPVEKIMKTLKLKILNRDKYIFESQKGNIDMIIED